jgi:hypothetical protein
MHLLHPETESPRLLEDLIRANAMRANAIDNSTAEVIISLCPGRGTAPGTAGGVRQWVFG